MNAHLQAYQKRLTAKCAKLERMERSGRTGARYDRLLRSWLELLAAYEYEYDIDEAGALLARAAS